MQKVKTYTKFKINEKAYRWRDDHGYWYIHCPSVMQMGFHEVRRSESDLLEQQYQELIAHVPDETLAEASRTDRDIYANEPWIHPVNETKKGEIPVPLRVVNTTAPSGPSHSWAKKKGEPTYQVENMVTGESISGAKMFVEPTRPSEEDMINKPSVNTNPGRAYTEGVGYDQHPQFRDIGIRIDRYDKLVFKPELTDGKD